jgi:hypothetical protein
MKKMVEGRRRGMMIEMTNKRNGKAVRKRRDGDKNRKGRKELQGIVFCRSSFLMHL